MKPLLAKILLLFLMLFGLTVFPGFGAMALAADTVNGAQVFDLHCAGCHINGGNIVRRGKTLKIKALQRNGMDSLEAIAQIVANGKNNMSAYSDRLTLEQIQAVSAYVLEQANQDWR